MSHQIELELRTVHFTTEPIMHSDAILSQCRAVPERGLRVRLSYGDGHQLAHELQGHETPRSHSIAVLRDVLECVGGQVSFASLRWDGTCQVRGGLQVSLPNRCVDFTVSPGQALAVTLRLGVALLVDEALFTEPTSDAVQPAQASETIATFLESLDLSGLGA
jgi:bifunctional DNase/RNase